MSNDVNIVEAWLQWNPIRWVAGALAGVLGGAIALGVAMLMAKSQGYELWFPAKLMATLVSGPQSTAIGWNKTTIVTGLIVFEVLCLILGVFFAHFTGTNCLSSLLGMGFVWGIFSWIFIWNLFLPAFTPLLWAQVSSGSVLPVCLVFGFFLASVAFFDRAMRSS